MISDIKIIDLKTHADERGFFREITRFSNEFPDINVGQISHSKVKEGIVKAWHGHVYQYQWNYVVSGILKVCLFDNRRNSSTYKKKVEIDINNIIMPVLYFFPPGVLHGYKCLEGPLDIIYITSGQYDLKDEVRISNEELNIDYKW